MYSTNVQESPWQHKIPHSIMVVVQHKDSNVISEQKLVQSANIIVSECLRDNPKLIRGIMQNDEVDQQTAQNHRLVQRNNLTIQHLTQFYIPSMKMYDC